MARRTGFCDEKGEASLMEDKKFLKIAVEQAKKSAKQGGFPAGAVVVKDGKVIAEGVSLGYILHDPTEHAETSAIKKACKLIGSSDLTGATLYESLECCNMCFSVAYQQEFLKLYMHVERRLKWLKNFTMKEQQTMNQ